MCLKRLASEWESAKNDDEVIRAFGEMPIQERERMLATIVDTVHMVY